MCTVWNNHSYHYYYYLRPIICVLMNHSQRISHHLSQKRLLRYAIDESLLLNGTIPYVIARLNFAVNDSSRIKEDNFFGLLIHSNKRPVSVLNNMMVNMKMRKDAFPHCSSLVVQQSLVGICSSNCKNFIASLPVIWINCGG